MKGIFLILAVFALANGELRPLIPKMPTLPALGPPPPPQSSGKIVGGYEASPHSRPFQVNIVIDDQFFCGGILLSDTWVLTAAHCTTGSTSIVVQLGAHDRSVPEAGRVEVASSQIITHENYSPLTINNDIGLVRLSSPVTLTSNIQPIQLPDPTSADLLDGEFVIVSGWGLTSDAALAQLSPTLNQVDLVTITNADCAAVYGDASVQEGKICTDGFGGVGPCSGDSGGPLTYEGVNGIEVRGIVSYGASAGCTAEFPSAYTRVNHYYDWIQTNTGGV